MFFGDMDETESCNRDPEQFLYGDRPMIHFSFLPKQQQTKTSSVPPRRVIFQNFCSSVAYSVGCCVSNLTIAGSSLQSALCNDSERVPQIQTVRLSRCT